MEKLKQVLAQEDTVLFIGSGISLWSGLPSWSGVIEELAKFVESAGGKADLVRAEAARGDLLQAASYGFDKLEWILESSLPLSDVHEPQLRSLMKIGNTIGGAAVTRLIAMKGPVIKDELLHEFVEARTDASS